MAKKYISGYSVFLAVILMVGCGSDDGVINSGNKPAVDDGILYTQAMCKAPRVIADNDQVRNELVTETTANATLAGLINFYCNQTIPQSRAINGGFAGPVEVPVNADEDIARALFQNISTDPGFKYENLRYIVTDWNSNGSVLASRITGDYDTSPFDIVFQYKDGWRNSGLVLNKQFLNNGAGIQLSNFDETVDLDTTLANSIVSGTTSEFTDLIYSYCSNTENIKYGLQHNAANISISGGRLESPLTSVIANPLQHDVTGSLVYFISNIRITVNPDESVKFVYDANNGSTTKNNQILDCNLYQNQVVF